ncbi:MAG: carbamoyltransferase HypF, partial [Candidatus Omnitrophota bacterium]
TGYGTDSNIWGGEFLLVQRDGFERATHLKYWKMPGGDKAVSEPWRMLLSIMGEEGADFIKDVPEKEKSLVLTMIEKDINSPLTSSAGRLFDAAAALLGICTYASYEAEGPIKLESMCDGIERGSYGFAVLKGDESYVIDTKGLFLGMARDINKGKAKNIIAARFHNSMSEIIVKTVKKVARRSGTKSVALSGGVFQNRFLKKKAARDLERSGFKVFLNSTVPANDLNIALGQYNVASHSRI